MRKIYMMPLRLGKEKAIDPDTTDEHSRTPHVPHVINQLRQNHISRKYDYIYCHRLFKVFAEALADEKERRKV